MLKFSRKNGQGKTFCLLGGHALDIEISQGSVGKILLKLRLNSCKTKYIVKMISMLLWLLLKLR